MGRSRALRPPRPSRDEELLVHAFIDRGLYLPKSWTTEKNRLSKAHVPVETSFATKPQIAQAVVACATVACVPFRWVAVDSVYGVGALEMALRRAGKGYVLGVNRNSEFHSWNKPDPSAACPLDRVNRQFKAPRPNALWVSDLSIHQFDGLSLTA